MRRFGSRPLALAGMALLMLGAAPAAPNYLVIERTISRIKTDWAKPGAIPQPNAEGWNTLFDATLGELHAYSSATTENERLTALTRLYKVSIALGSVGWGPAGELRESLRDWLRPRVRLAWAERRLVEEVNRLPAADPATQSNRARWVRFVETELSGALQKYDAATTVAHRQEALKTVQAAVEALQTLNRSYLWSPSRELQSAMDDLFNLPNVDVSVDRNTLAPNFATNLITTGPVYRKGYWSQVTAGPHLGFGLIPSDDGIAFYNRQAMTSVTPITDFQKQVAANPQGKRAAKMYQFNATQSDNSVLTITIVIRPSSGITIYPTYQHNVNADINTTPQARGGLTRAFASLLGFDQTKITQMAWENAIGQIRSNVVKEAQLEANERTSKEAAQRNTQLAQYLVGGDRLVFRNLLIEGLSFRSRAENALIGGKLTYLNARDQVGANGSQPPEFLRPDGGVSADLHLSSILTNFTRGYLQSDAARDVENLMVITRKIAPNQPPSEGVILSRNVDYPTFLRAISTTQAANDPKVAAIRVKRPPTAPDFGVDAKGNLVALINNFEIEVPVPAQVAKGGGGALPPAKVLKIVSPQAEFVIAFKVEPKTATEPLRLAGRIESFDPGPRAKVYAINDDEKQAKPLNAFASIFVLGGFRTKLQGQPIDIPLSNLQLQGFAIQSVSPLDPSGWIRVNLVRTSQSPTAGIR